MEQPDDLAYIVVFSTVFITNFHLLGPAAKQTVEALDQLEAAIKKYRGEESDGPCGG